MFTTDITFRFHITDNSNYTYNNNVIATDNNDNREDCNSSSNSFSKALVTAALAESSKATVNIEYKALHPISSESWDKQNSIYSYTPEEFKRGIVNIDPKQAANTQVYDILVAT